MNIFKSTGSALLHSRILRTLKDMLCAQLTHIFNKTAETGINPKDGNLPAPQKFPRKKQRGT